MEFFKVNIKGVEAQLPILPLPSGIKIAFFNLHGDASLTEHCGKELAKLVGDSEVLITAESKGLQLTHVVARECNLPDYARWYFSSIWRIYHNRQATRILPFSKGR